jgi:hypothetical protein
MGWAAIAFRFLRGNSKTFAVGCCASHGPSLRGVLSLAKAAEAIQNRRTGPGLLRRFAARNDGRLSSQSFSTRSALPWASISISAGESDRRLRNATPSLFDS